MEDIGAATVFHRGVNDGQAWGEGMVCDVQDGVARLKSALETLPGLMRLVGEGEVT